MLGYQPVNGINTFRFLFMNPVVDQSDVNDVLDYLAKAAATEWAANDPVRG